MDEHKKRQVGEVPACLFFIVRTVSLITCCRKGKTPITIYVAVEVPRVE